MSVLIGINAHPASGGARQRQADAVESIRRLTGVELVNLQFRHGTPEISAGVECLPILEQDSHTATRAGGARKPLLTELCGALAAEADRRGSEYFCFANADILFTQNAVDEMRGRGREGYAFSRMEVDPASGADTEINLGGVDVIAARPAWWLTNTFRFRPFIVGEPLWDQMYASILLRHADALLFNTHPLVRHVTHPLAWSPDGPFPDYNGYLGALDSHYFSRWCEYHTAREEWCRRGGTEAEHFAIQRAVFTRPWPRFSWLVQSLRRGKAWAGYQRRRRTRRAISPRHP